MSTAEVLEPPRTTWQEWLDLEDAREDRHELIDGRLVLDRLLDVTDGTLPMGPVLVDSAEVFAEVDELEHYGD